MSHWRTHDPDERPQQDARTLTLGIPKGSLEAATLALFAQVGFQFSGTDRSLRLSSSDPEIRPVLIRPQEMPEYVATGRLDAGLAGMDWVEEQGAKKLVVFLADLQYAKQSSRPVRWVVAVRNDSGIFDIDDLKKEAEWRNKEGGKLRIATELKNFSEQWLEAKNIKADVEFSWGATEAKVAAGFVDAIIEATETGTSLRENNLREIGVVKTSTTQLFANRDAYDDDLWKRQKLDRIAQLLRSALGADEFVQLTVLSREAMDVAGLLPSRAHVVTVTATEDESFLYVALLPKSDVAATLPAVIAAGSSDAWVSSVSILYRPNLSASARFNEEDVTGKP